MKLVSFPEKRIALALSDYLSSIGIPNHLEQIQGAFALLLNNPDDIAQARHELDAFIGKHRGKVGRLRRSLCIPMRDHRLP